MSPLAVRKIMFNFLHSKIYRPERGWDPVAKGFAESHSEKEWAKIESLDMDELERRLGGLAGRRLLDLGGGPGQYSVAFASRGARVTWHDVSRNYREIVQRKAAARGVNLEYSLGYLEEAEKFGADSFDIVFCRICWYYCRNDPGFARMILGLVKPGGTAYVNVPTSRGAGSSSPLKLAQRLLYLYPGLKIGHPFPKPGLVPALFAALAPAHLEVDSASGKNDKILMVK
jgi:2-polyprenyl-3-methyl-5-hydroxy-6-metoxy-1,4-benzoquinol methylase